MKITIEIDCTPAEARQFMGLPDLQPMQDRLLDEMEARLRKAASAMTPEVMMQQWFSAWPMGLNRCAYFGNGWPVRNSSGFFRLG